MSTQSDPIHYRLKGKSLTIAELESLARDPRARIDLDKGAMKRVDAGAALVQRVVTEYRKHFSGDAGPRSAPSDQGPVLDYGITTGFGEFKRVPIAPADLERLQRNILLSHAVGVGESADRDDPSSYFPPDVVRAAMALRINAFLKGNSGVRRELVEHLQTMFNLGIVPLVPIRGSVGSSGDLCPLSHLFVVLLEEGRKDSRFVVMGEGIRVRRLNPREARPASELAAAGLPPLEVSYKEGLALTNGAAFSTALLALAVHDAERTANAADVALALSLEAARGCARAFDRKVHAARAYRGQADSARNVRWLLQGSQLIESFDDVQDPYSLRCAPQVHGASRDTLAYARMVVECEMNSATDNPLFFPGTDHAESFEKQFSGNWKCRTKDKWERLEHEYKGEVRCSYSAGNFHGQPVGLAADFLAIALAELANISERRTQMLLDGNHNRGLPVNLVPNGGLNSGLMIAQYTAAGIVSENKVLCHPASVDSIPTSSNSEDHNSMSTIAARKLRTVLGNTQAVLAIELLSAAQAIDWATARAYLHGGDSGEGDAIDRTRKVLRASKALRPKTGWLAKSKQRWKQENAELAYFKAWVGADEGGSAGARVDAIAGRLGVGTAAAYRAVRSVVPAITTDVLLEPLAREVRALVEGGWGGAVLVDQVDEVLAARTGQRLSPVPRLRSS